MDLKRTLLLAIDVQRGFGSEAASDKLQGLGDSEASEIERVADLAEAVHGAGGTVVVSKDWHERPGTVVGEGLVDNRSAEEFALFGEHCVPGTSDAELNPALEARLQTLEPNRTVIGVDRFDTTARKGAPRVIEVHKNIYDVTKTVDLDGTVRPNQAFLYLLAQAEAQGINTVLISGKVAEVCVRAAAQSITTLFPSLHVVIVPDATSSLGTKQQTLTALASEGIASMHSAQVLLS